METIETNIDYKIFNTPLEIGLRVLAILNSHSSNSMDVERLMYFDYLSLNTGDIGGEESLHAPVPNRGVQVFARKDLIQRGIAILLSKELIDVQATKFGFNYTVNKNGEKFLSYFDSEYYQLLVTRIAWVVKNFAGFSNEELRGFIREKLQEWGGDFLTDSTINKK